MAKSKKSRRPRREQIERQKPTIIDSSTTVESTPGRSEIAANILPTPKAAEPAPSVRRKIIDFGQDYFYVYTEMRNILIVTVAMFAVMIGLSFFI
jgi:hypothetical protein